MATYANVSGLNQTLVRKALTGSMFVAPYSTTTTTSGTTTTAITPAITASTLFGTDGSLATSLPTGYKDVGTADDNGVVFSRSTDSDDITAWQFLENVRSDLTKDTESCKITFLETNYQTISLYTGIDLSALTSTNHALTIDKPQIPQARYLRVLVLAVDNYNGQEFYIARHYPRMRVTSWDDQSFAKKGALSWGVTLTAYTDPVLNISKRDMLGGPAFMALQASMGFSLT